MGDTVKNLCIRVPLDKGEEIRLDLLRREMLRDDLKVKHDEQFVYLPLKKGDNDIKDYKVGYMDFKRIDRHKRLYYKEIIRIPGRLKKYLPSSYDIIGDMILIKIPEELEKYKSRIGESLIQANKHAKVVCSIRPVKGELRLRDVEIIAGEKRTETIHREYGLVFKLDIRKTYYSPRLANERRCIASMVKPGEIIVDMFTGVAPFPIMIAKYAEPRIIYGIDKNADAIRYAEYNIRVNKVHDKVELINIDACMAKKELDSRMVKADRVIMNLPFQAYRFFDEALDIIKDKAMIHYYDIIREEDVPTRLDYLKSSASEKSISIEPLAIRRIKTYSPREFYIGVDIQATKKI
ncbi:MAG: class I SAM-dependent methyltransferase family protein [Candidatus Thermoplasmatota archaeon]